MSELPNYETLNIEVKDHIAHVQFSRPQPRNSMHKTYWLQLPRCVQDIEANAGARVIVISSTGKHFSAGMDLGVFSDPKSVPMSGDPGRMAENLRRVVLQLQDTLSSLEKVRLPVLAAVHGGCIGGALDLVCAADSRYCTADAYFTIKVTELGMTADVGTLQRLPNVIAEGVVREPAYTGRKFGGEDAQRHAFVNTVYSTQEAMREGIMPIAAQISANPPLAVTACKEMINFSRDHSVEDSLKYMATWQAGMFRPGDMMKSFQAKAQKQAPSYDALFPVKDLFDN